MYETYYGFREKPFSLVPDPNFLYLGRHHRAALNMLEYGLRGEASFVLISGEIGSGKTILIRRFLRMVDQQTTIGLITNTHASLGSLLDWILLAFNLDYRGKDKIELFDIFTKFLRDQHSHGRRTVLIIDEAQNLELDTLEEVRMLSNINVDSVLMLQIVLAGQPEILDKINRPEMRQLAQRISASFHLSPLTLDETRDYICHRLMVAGGGPEIFDNLTCAAVYYFTEGLPRPINILCDAALVYGFGGDQETIGLEIILEVVEDAQRGGLKALSGVENDFSRDELVKKISELATTYISSKPLEKEFESLEMIGIEQEDSEPAGSERDAIAPQDSFEPVNDPLTVGPRSESVRDVPRGIPPTTDGEGRIKRQVGTDEQLAARRQTWRRLFAAAAAFVLVLIAAVSFLRGLEVWSEHSVSLSDPSQTVSPTETVSAAELQPSSTLKALQALASAKAEQAGDTGEPKTAEPLQTVPATETVSAAEPQPSVTRDALQALAAAKAEQVGDTGEPKTAEPPQTEAPTETAESAEPQDGPAPQTQQTVTAGTQSQPNADRSKAPAAVPVQTAARTSSAVATTTIHWVRLGVFGQSGNASIMWQRLQRTQADLLANLPREVRTLKRGDKDPFYLLQIGPMADAEASKSLCRVLTQRGVDCLATIVKAVTAEAPPAKSIEAEVAEAPKATLSEVAASLSPRVVTEPQSPVSPAAEKYKLALTHNQNGQTHAKNFDYGQAIKEYDEAIRLDPGFALAYYYRGNAQHEIGGYDQAVRNYDEAIRLDPDYAKAYYNRGVAHRKMGNYDLAVRDYFEAKRLDASMALAYGDYAAAIHQDVRLAQDHFDRGNSHRRKGNYSQAIQDLDEAIRLNPGLTVAYNVRAWVLYLLKRNKEALPDAERAVSLTPNNAYNLGTKAHVLAALGRQPDAFAVFNQAMAVADAKWIKSYQKALKRHGYYAGRVDGVYNLATRAALEACLKVGCRVIK